MNHGRDVRATLRNQSQLFSQLHGLGSAPGAQLVTSVAGLAATRNRMSDAHARTYRPDRHHARLAVNAANTLVDFLLKSYTLRQRKDAKDLAIKVTDHLSV